MKTKIAILKPICIYALLSFMLLLKSGCTHEGHEQFALANESASLQYVVDPAYETGYSHFTDEDGANSQHNVEPIIPDIARSYFLSDCDDISYNSSCPIDLRADYIIEADDEPDIPIIFYDDESYMRFMGAVSGLMPFYQIIIAFERLPNGISSLPRDRVLDMFNELNAAFHFVLVHENPLIHIGYYDGDTRFVLDYERFSRADNNTMVPNRLNFNRRDWDGNAQIGTALITVTLSENIASIFDQNIAQGRNLIPSDFILASSDSNIPVVLGASYKDVHEIGDVLTLEYISVMMNFEVVGFFEPGVGFNSGVGALHRVEFDNAIIVPYFILDYEPVGDAETFQHAFHIGSLTSGLILISEGISEAGNELHEMYMQKVNEIAERHGLSDMYLFPTWPLGFIFD